MTLHQQQDGADVVTPAVHAGFSGSDDTVYVIPVAERTPSPGKKAGKRRRSPDGRESRDSLYLLTDENDWRETLFGSCCGAASPAYWLRVALCPCATAAAVNERLGSSFELALLYFGVLASGFFVSTGLAITFDQTNGDGPPHHGGFGGFPPRDSDDGFPPRDPDDGWSDRNGSSGGGFDGPPRRPPPPFFRDDVSLGKNPKFWAALAVGCVLLFLLGVWMLRDQTRQRLALRGTKLGDLVVSLACSCCALGQMDLELSHSKLASRRRTDRRRREHQRREQDAHGETDATAVRVVTLSSESSAVRVPRHDAADTLAAYPNAALV